MVCKNRNLVTNIKTFVIMILNFFFSKRIKLIRIKILSTPEAKSFLVKISHKIKLTEIGGKRHIVKIGEKYFHIRQLG